ncbi:hypothetical protein SLEP1_g2467 [Rubroshorea leprosula]|uniref:Uncharacterized protein n=1 Tax=Rubroshorea leprosula TaxID=152421 RepID=A0AAV5HR18_9ROSI|nr:hypothetical protein SLEP1_g2467 [Rubroshorea leprosula]
MILILVNGPINETQLKMVNWEIIPRSVGPNLSAFHSYMAVDSNRFKSMVRAQKISPIQNQLWYMFKVIWEMVIFINLCEPKGPI